MTQEGKEISKGHTIERKPVSIFIPIFNEEEIIEKHAILVYDFLKQHFISFELIIVDDASSDNTRRISRELSTKYNELTYIRYDHGPSRRENLAEAMKTAKYDTIAYMDIDLAVPLGFAIPLVEAIWEGFDMAIGSRYLRGARFKRGTFRLLISWIYHNCVRFLFDSKITDYQCGFKAFDKERLLALLDDLGYEKEFVRGWFWDAELLLRAERKKYKIKHIPVFWRSGVKSTFNIGRELRAVPYILKMYLEWKK